MLSLKKYTNCIERASNILRTTTKQVELNSNTQSTIFAKDNRKSKQNNKINLDELNGIIEINTEMNNPYILVGGRTTYKSITKILQKYNYAPKIIPELDTITVGGAIAGCSIESSSYRNGMIHDTLISIDVLISNGDILTCSKIENEDLFYGISHSYGTLGYIVTAKIGIEKIPPYLDIKIYRHTSFEDSIKMLSCHDSDVMYVEGLVFDPNNIVTIKATVPKEERLNKLINDNSYTHRNLLNTIFFQNTSVVKLPDAGPFIDLVKNNDSLTISTYDYFWRWDTDVFWGILNIPIISYIVRIKLIRAILGRLFFRTSVLLKLKSFVCNVKTIIINFFGIENEYESVIQDLGVHIEKYPEFSKNLINDGVSLPLWLCPYKPTTFPRNSLLFPEPEKNKEFLYNFYIDIATFGQVKSGNNVNQKVNLSLKKSGGVKSFYSDIGYSREEAYKIYNGEQYDYLKNKYDPINKFPTIWNKMNL